MALFKDDYEEKYGELVKKYNGLVNEYNQVANKNKKLESENKKLKDELNNQEKINLKLENEKNILGEKFDTAVENIEALNSICLKLDMENSKNLKFFGEENAKKRKKKNQKNCFFETKKATIIHDVNIEKYYLEKRIFEKENISKFDFIKELVIQSTFDKSVFPKIVKEKILLHFDGEFDFYYKNPKSEYDKRLFNDDSIMYIDQETDCWCLILRNIVVKNADAFLKNVNKGVAEEVFW